MGGLYLDMKRGVILGLVLFSFISYNRSNAAEVVGEMRNVAINNESGRDLEVRFSDKWLQLPAGKSINIALAQPAGIIIYDEDWNSFIHIKVGLPKNTGTITVDENLKINAQNVAVSSIRYS